VLARSGSNVAGKLYPIHVPEGPITEAVRSRVHADYQTTLRALVREQNVDIVHYHGVDCEAYLVAEQPTVVTLHLARMDYTTPLLARAGIQFVCVSRHQARAFTSLRARVIRNGVDLQRFRPASTRGDYFASLGRICPEKGFEMALRAAREQGLDFVLAGRVFPYAGHVAYFEQCIAPLLSDTRRFVGALAGAEKVRLIAEARAVLITSRVPETSSLAAIEALACGTPVIAFASGNLPSLLAPGRTGLLVDDERELGAAMSRASELDRAACRAEAEATCGVDLTIARYLELYRELAMNRPRGAAGTGAFAQ
jgi:glycosyltransferase involved in cell wall biosynthesis